MWKKIKLLRCRLSSSLPKYSARCNSNQHVDWVLDIASSLFHGTVYGRVRGCVLVLLLFTFNIPHSTSSVWKATRASQQAAHTNKLPTIYSNLWRSCSSSTAAAAATDTAAFTAVDTSTMSTSYSNRMNRKWKNGIEPDVYTSMLPRYAIRICDMHVWNTTRANHELYPIWQTENRVLMAFTWCLGLETKHLSRHSNTHLLLSSACCVAGGRATMPAMRIR